MEERALTILMTLVGILAGRASSDIPLTVFTDPVGPNYQAASWIRFACRTNIGTPSMIQYQWTGRCSASDRTEFTIDDPFLDEEGYAVIWVQATPISCLDQLECSVVDDSGDIGVNSTSIVNATGVGLSIPDKSMEQVANNSAIIVSHDSQAPELLCQSSARQKTSSFAITWKGPDGNQVSANVQQTEQGASDYIYSGLPLDKVAEEGVYTCLVPDEYGEERQLLVGVYSDTYPRNSPAISMDYEVEQDSLLMVCATTGFPPTATLWSKDGILLSLNETYSEDMYITEQAMTDAHTASYRNTLKIVQDRSEMDGLYGCDVYSDWVTADFTLNGREHVSRQFAHYTVGATVTFNCAFAEDTHLVEWLYNDEVLQYNGSNMLALKLTVSDAFHDNFFICRGTSLGGVTVHWTKMIVYVPNDAMTLIIDADEADTPMVPGRPFSVTCCASMNLFDGVSSTPQLFWIGPDGEEFLATGSPGHDTISFNVSETDGVLCGSLYINSLEEAHQGSYACVATLESPALTEPLTKTKQFRVQVSGDEDGGSSSSSVPVVAVVSPVAVMLLIVGALLLVVTLALLRKRLSNTKNGV